MKYAIEKVDDGGAYSSLNAQQSTISSPTRKKRNTLARASDNDASDGMA
jgi:hypothetical protein